jgi:hypothetical protein
MRNAKVMRRIVRTAFLGEKFGDTSVSENPTSLNEIQRTATGNQWSGQSLAPREMVTANERETIAKLRVIARERGIDLRIAYDRMKVAL